MKSVGAVARASGASADGLTRDLELLILPLAHRGRMDARILGALAPAEAPYWLGAGALGGLTLGSLRYLGDAVPAGFAPRIVPTIRRGASAMAW